MSTQRGEGGGWNKAAKTARGEPQQPGELVFLREGGTVVLLLTTATGEWGGWGWGGKRQNPFPVFWGVWHVRIPRQTPRMWCTPAAARDCRPLTTSKKQNRTLQQTHTRPPQNTREPYRCCRPHCVGERTQGRTVGGWKVAWLRVPARPLLSDTGGGGGQIGPQGFWLTHPPTHIRKFFLRKKMKFIKGARTWRSILGTQTFFWPLTPPPPGIVSTSH